MCRKNKFLSVSRYCFFSCFLYLSFFGCATSHKEAKPIKEDIPYAVSEEPSIKHEGSLWQDNGSLSKSGTAQISLTQLRAFLSVQAAN